HGHPRGALPAARQPGRARILLSLEGDPETAYGLVAVDLAPAFAPHPADPGHRHERDDDRRHQPEQDLHLARVRTSVSRMSEPKPVRLVDLRETPLDVDEVVAALEDETSGGLTLFVGRVRDHDHGKGVLG